MTREESPRLRFDATTNDWVLFAPARARRPHAPTLVDPAKPAVSNSLEICPFCPGPAEKASPDILRLGGPEPAGWSVRVIPNKYPALIRSVSLDQRELGREFREMDGYGAHEVVIESPNHSCFLADQPLTQVELVLHAIHTRFLALMSDKNLRAIVVFKNHGSKAGTSIAHPHWQIIATPVVPRQLRLKHEIATEYFDRTGQCLYCVELQEELLSGTRVLETNDHFAAILPFASHLPYQIRILPRAVQSSFAAVDPTQMRSLASMLQLVLRRLDRVLGKPHFNLTLETAPIGDEEKRYFLWHIDVLLRLTTPAGFELGSGMAINPVLPERAAAELRQIAID